MNRTHVLGHPQDVLGRTHPPSIEGVSYASVPSKKKRTTYSAEWRRLVRETIARGATCVDCGTDGDVEGDHEWPASKGGLSTRANLAIRCRGCNRSKRSRISRCQLRVPWPVTPALTTISRENLHEGSGSRSDLRSEPAPPVRGAVR